MIIKKKCSIILSLILFVLFSCSSNNKQIMFVFDEYFSFSLPKSTQTFLQKKARILILKEEQNILSYPHIWNIAQARSIVVLPTLLSEVQKFLTFFSPKVTPELWVLPFGNISSTIENKTAVKQLKLDRTSAFREVGRYIAHQITDAEVLDVAIFLFDRSNERHEVQTMLASLRKEKGSEPETRIFYYPIEGRVVSKVRNDIEKVTAETYVLLLGSILGTITSSLTDIQGKVIVESFFPLGEDEELFAVDGVISFNIDDFIASLQEKRGSRGYVPAHFLRYSSE